jgi:hypothetical protein
MPDSTLGNLTAATANTGGFFYGTQSNADRKFTLTAAGASVIESTAGAGNLTLGGTITAGANIVAAGSFASTSGNVEVYSNAGLFSFGAAADVILTRGAAAATLQLGSNAASGVNQTIKACNGTAGAGGDLILKGGTGTTTNGNVRFGTHSAVVAELVTGYITIKDESGTLRKLAVIS